MNANRRIRVGATGGVVLGFIVLMTVTSRALLEPGVDKPPGLSRGGVAATLFRPVFNLLAARRGASLP